MNVTAAPSLETLRARYQSAQKAVTEQQAELDSAVVGLNEHAEKCDKLANNINRWVAVRNKMPMVGMGSFMVGMGLVQGGLVFANPLVMGVGLVGLATCAACVVGIETWKIKGPKMRAQHNQMLAVHDANLSRVNSRTGQLNQAVEVLKSAQAALATEEASIDELKRLLKPPQLAGIAEQTGAVTVGGVRIPKRPNPEKR